MLDLTTELRRIVEVFDAAGVAYALAGGLAVSIYAVPRATQDIDMLIAVSDLDRVITPLGRVGFRIVGRPMTMAGGRLDIQRFVKTEGADLLPLDLLLPTDPVLGQILTTRVEIPWEGARLSIVTLEGLRTLKRLRGSAQDLADLEALGGESP